MVRDRHRKSTSPAIHPPLQPGRYTKLASTGMVVALASSLAPATSAAPGTPTCVRTTSWRRTNVGHCRLCGSEVQPPGYRL